MLTMPQWFQFMHVDEPEAISGRLEKDLREYGEFTYYFGIAIALGSSALDSFTYFLIRSIST